MSKYLRHLHISFALVSFTGFMFFAIRTSQAQDIHFSQFYATPFMVNPAYSGLYYGDFRVTGIYRQQWKSISEPFVSNAISADYQFYLASGNRLSAGLQVVGDEAGVGSLKTTQTHINGAYHTSYGLNNLHAGIQLGYIEQGVDVKKFTFPNQFDRDIGQFSNENEALPNGESNLQENTSYLDATIGFAWSRNFGKFKPEAGIAIYHVNFHKKSLTKNDTARTKARPVISGGGTYTINDKYYIMPMFKYMFQTRASDMLIGGNVARNLPKNKAKVKAVYAGMQLRSGIGRSTDAGILMLGMFIHQVRAGFSYDFNISSLRESSSYRGALEFSLIYTGLSTQLDRGHIPCNRY